MTVLPPRPRFHLLLWSQLTASAMVVSGMAPYWFRVGGAKLTSTISWRTGVVAGILFLMFLIPQGLNRGTRDLEELEMEEKEEEGNNNRSERLADNQVFVQRIIWIYCLVDLVLLTYLVHVTGGMTGSMFAGLYLLVPALDLLLMLGMSDLRKAAWLIFGAILGIFGSFCMSLTGKIEYDAASNSHKAFNIALTAVSLEGAFLLLIQLIVLRHQFAKKVKQDKPQPLTQVVERR
jgi:hypothetical protein